MSTIIFYACRDPHHLAAPSRYGIGGIVFRHGTAAYCDGLGVDTQHHWVPTGGIPLESIIRPATTNRLEDQGVGAYFSGPTSEAAPRSS